MLTFNHISWRNFLSTGNQVNSVNLDKYSSTLITGKNGEGKSTLLDALCFALFGRPFRNINKAQLINSINRKNCVVEITFSVNGRNYRIVRGIKPNVFEIYCDGDLVNQDASVKDYQRVLEQQILKHNFKTFTQVVILGSATFVPFMQLTSAQRREVVEDVLDIKIFSLMNTLLKDKIAETRDELANIESAITNQKVKIDAQKKLIDTLVASKNDIVVGLEQKIEVNDKMIADTQVLVDRVVDQIKRLQTKQKKFEQVSDALATATKMRMVAATKVDTCSHTIDFFNSNETCPSCRQHILPEYKEAIVQDLSTEINQHRNKYNEVSAVVDKLKDKVDELQQALKEITDKSIELSALNNTISVLSKQNTTLRMEITTAQQDTGNITEEKAKLRILAEQAIAQVETKTSLLDHRNLQDVAALLLKDTGIKTAIIREYLPVMNKLINKYLTAMDFYVKFELDESFNEVIKSRGRDEFTYASFSEGEKRRLDLAILFTWRQIAKMKNSVNTNIMILDEILDGALDSGGIDYFLSIMNQFGEHTNVFVISHKVDQMIDKFDYVVRFEKKNDFSVITSS